VQPLFVELLDIVAVAKQSFVVDNGPGTIGPEYKTP